MTYRYEPCEFGLLNFETDRCSPLASQLKHHVGNKLFCENAFIWSITDIASRPGLMNFGVVAQSTLSDCYRYLVAAATFLF
jgi:hypothetical protein